MSRAVVPLRALLVLLFVLLLVFQTLSLPGQLRHGIDETPEDAGLLWSLTAVAVLWLLCVEVVIVSTWKLLGMVTADRIFSDDSRRWVDAIVWAIAAAWLLLAGVLGYVGLHADDPGAPMLLFAVLVALGAFGLLMLVMRALLFQATSLRSDLEAVI